MTGSVRVFAGLETGNGRTPQELEAEALKLPAAERALLAGRLLASLTAPSGSTQEDPIHGLGSAPVFIGAARGSVEHDRYLYGNGPR